MPSKGPDRPKGSAFDDILHEERDHAAKQVQAAKEGDVAAVAEHERVHQERQAETAKVLLDYEHILDAALTHLRVKDLLEEMLRHIRDLMHAEVGAILFANPTREWLSVEAVQGFKRPELLPGKVPIGKWIGGRVMAEERPLLLMEEELWAVAHPVIRAEGVRSMLGVPLLLEGETVGVLLVGSKRRRVFSEQELDLLQLVGSRAALAIDRARLLDREAGRRVQAEKVSQFKTDLLNMASHDLRGPLTAIKMQAHLLAGARDDAARHAKALGILRRNLVRMELMLDDFLDLARLEARRFVLHRTRVDLRKVVADVLDALEPQAVQYGIRLTRALDGELFLQGDERRLVQVLSNVVGNALRYTPDGGRIHVAAMEEDGHVAVRVEDDGIGMTQEQIAHLFQPFGQVHGIDMESKGSGLGLYLSRTIVEQHGGKMAVESPGPGKGTTVMVRLPKDAPPAQ